MLDLHSITDPFVQEIASGMVEIYNEFSLQHELGLFLRTELGDTFRVQFERPTQFFGIGDRLTKREIDISVFKPGRSECHAIELKYPRNGQYPEQMFHFCKDVAFLEDLVRHGGMTSGMLLIVADDPLFHGRGSSDGIYGPFRGGTPLTGEIRKPTGKRDAVLKIERTYCVEWVTLAGSMKCARIVIRD